MKARLPNLPNRKILELLEKGKFNLKRFRKSFIEYFKKLVNDLVAKSDLITEKERV